VAASAALLVLLAVTSASAQLDQLLRGLPSSSTSVGVDDGKIRDGLKQALEVGTEHAVAATGKTDGYFGNAAIKILMPDSLRTVERGLRAAGQGAQIDELVLGMNRAAERAAPAARRIFVDTIAAMGFDDARRILQGPDNAATQYFKDKATGKLSAAFAPVVSSAMDEVGVTRQYKALTGGLQALPFGGLETFDLDRYVVGKALDGLFVVVGDEERKIRKEPAARVTPLLKEVFAR
jgi:hypothetical protein